MSILDCYGADLDALADLVGDFDYLSTREREAWVAGQWRMIAQAMGWSDELDAALERIKTTRLGLAQSTAVAIAAFRSVASGDEDEEPIADRARVRQTVLMTLGAHTTNVWRIDADAASVPSGVCFSSGRAAEGRGSIRERAARLDSPGKSLAQDELGREVTTDDTLAKRRAFLADSGPSYFWGPAPRVIHYRPGCGLESPLRVSLGTFPWVYGRRLQAPSPGLLWRSSGEYIPAAIGLEIATSLWHPAGNLRQDAREVVAHWQHWRETTRGLIDALPEAGDEPQRGDELYRSGALLQSAQDDEYVGVNGPRGFICAAAYNYIQQRFAAFFAMRRALLRARGRLPKELRVFVDANPDPCIPQDLNVARETST